MNLILTIKDAMRLRQPSIQLILLKIFIIGIFLPIKASNVTLLLLLAFWIINADYKNALPGLKENKVLLLLIGFYLLHILGLAWSDDVYTGYKELEKKLPMLLLPLILASVNSKILQTERSRLLAFYVKTTGAVCLLLLLYALYRYTATGDANLLYFKEFTAVINLNVIYLAMFVLFAFCIYFYEPESHVNSKPVHHAMVYLYTLIILMFISSKNALAVFGLISLHLVFTKIQMKPVVKIGGVIGVISLIVVLINAFPVTKERINDSINSDFKGILEDEYTMNAITYTGTTLRISFWKVAIKEMNDDRIFPIGVGTGDVLHFLNKAYQRYGLLDAGYRNFNLHNAYMEVLVEFGILGCLFYFIMLVMLFLTAVKKRDPVFMLLLIIFCFFSLTESILYVNKGIVFFFFFFSLLIITSRKKPGKSAYLQSL